MLKFNVKKLNNHWYPCIEHELGCIRGFNTKIDRYFNAIDISKSEELTIEFEELGVIFAGINIIYFNENDILKYLTTDYSFDLRFVINDNEFEISSDLYWLLENQFNFNFHKTSYKIHIY